MIARAEIAAPGGPIPVVWARPEGDGPWPTVVVLHEVWGLNDDILAIAARFARHGYLAVAPDLYRDRGMLRCVVQTFTALLRGRGDAVRSLHAVIDAAQAHDDSCGVGVVGFCMGGGFALLMGSQVPDVRAVGVYYGDLSPAVDWPVLCPVVGGYGAHDLALGHLGERLRQRCADHEVPHDVVTYPDAGHSYLNRSAGPILRAVARPLMRLDYDEDAAEDSWKRMLAFFEIHVNRDAP